MAQNDEQLEEAARAIRDAFAAVSYPGDDCIATNQQFHPSDAFDCARVLTGKHWSEVTPESLVECGHPFLTPQALLFFLPAYMLAKLLYPERVRFEGDSIVYSLVSPTTGPIGRIQMLMDARQRDAIRRFLEVIAARDTQLREPVEEAVVRYWGHF